MNRNSTPKCDFIHEQGLSKITIPNRFVTEENKDFQWVMGRVSVTLEKATSKKNWHKMEKTSFSTDFGSLIRR